MDILSRRGAIGLGFLSGPAILAACAEAGAGIGLAGPDVAIAVPVYDGHRPITIGPGRHFHVVVANRSDRPFRVWPDHCSWGESNLAFEVSDGRAVVPIRRRPQMWSKNLPRAVELGPDDQYVLEVSFDPDAWELPWEETKIGTRRVRMRAVYQSEPSEDAKTKGVWTGRVVSRYGDYTLSDNRR